MLWLSDYPRQMQKLVGGAGAFHLNCPCGTDQILLRSFRHAKMIAALRVYSLQFNSSEESVGGLNQNLAR
jgi:hypothetical protein